MVFHETARWDVIRMIKLNVAWDLKSVVFSESGQEMFDTVSPLFIEANARRSRKLLAIGASVLADLTPLEIEFVQRVSDELSPAPGTSINADSLYIVLAGNVTFNGHTLSHGDCFGTAAMLGQSSEGIAIAGEGTRLMKVTPSDLNTLSEKHPRLGLKLYRNLAAQARE
jgi:CRP-like cAMP-binding protein